MSNKHAEEPEKEVRMEEKEVTSVEDVETVVREEARGDPNLMKFIEQMNENLMKQINEKFDGIKEDSKRMEEKLVRNKEETNDNFKKQKEDNERFLKQNSKELKTQIKDDTETLNNNIESNHATLKRNQDILEGK